MKPDVDQSRPEAKPLQPKKKRRWLWRILALVIILPTIVIAIGFYLVTRPTFLINQLEPMLSKELGGDITIGNVDLVGSEQIILRNVMLKSPKHSGEPSEILTVPTMTINADLLGLVRGSNRDLNITLTEPIFRAAENREAFDEFTFMALEIDSDGSDGADGQLVLEVERGKIEVGTFLNHTFFKEGELLVAGTLHNRKDDVSIFNFDLRETDAHGLPLTTDGLALQGSVNTKSFAISGSVDDLRFDQSLKSLCPQSLQKWWDRLDIDGKVNRAELSFTNEDQQMEIELSIRDVGLTIPIDDEQIWSRYANNEAIPATGRPRMRINSGTLSFIDGQLQFEDVSGRLISTVADETFSGLPYRLRGTMGPLSTSAGMLPIAWADADLAHIPMDLQFYLDGFEFDAVANANETIELPTAVARIFERFHVRSCTLDTSISLFRAPSKSAKEQINTEDHSVTRNDNVALTPSPLTTTGRARLQNGRGAFDKFRYPLDDITAEISFTQDRLDILSLLGVGRDGGKISIGGWIAPIGKHPQVALHIDGRDIPIDDRLRSALPAHLQNVLDSILHQPSLDYLTERGMIPTASDIEDISQKITRTADRLQRLQDAEVPNEQRITTVQRRLQSLKRMQEQGAFELGGRVDLDLDVQRDAGVGEGQKTTVTGDITFVEGGFVLDSFPYPFTVTSGAIRVGRDDVLLDNMIGTSIGGGIARVHGRIDMVKREDGSRKVLQDIQVGLIDDIISDATVAILPMIGSPGNLIVQTEGTLAETADALQRSGLRGLLSCEGDVTNDDAGKVDWSIGIVISNGRIEPRKGFTESMTRFGLRWPENFTINNIDASLLLTRDRLSIANLAGTHKDGGMLTIDRGHIDFAGDAREVVFDVSMNNVAYQPMLLEWWPSNAHDNAVEVYEDLQPIGRFDGTLRFVKIADDVQPIEFTFLPRDTTIMLDEQRLALSADQPMTITTSSDSTRFEGVHWQLFDTPESDDRDSISPSLLKLSGKYDSRNSMITLDATLDDGRFESPWVHTALARFGGRALIDEWEKYEPMGKFDMQFALQPSDSTPGTTFRATVHPETLAVTYNDHRISALLDNESRIEIADRVVDIHALTGRVASQASFAVDGRFDFSQPLTSANLVISYAGAIDSEELLAFLPTGVKEAATALELSTQKPLSLREGQLLITQLANQDSNEKENWRYQFSGPVQIDDAAFTAGMAFSDVDATMQVTADVSTHPTSLPSMTLQVASPVATAMKRELRNITADIALSDDGNDIVLSNARAELSGGTLAATATAGLDDDGFYDVTLDLVGANLKKFVTTKPDEETTNSPATNTSDGTLYANISLEGQRGNLAERRGRGSLRVVDGQLANNPITLPLLQLSQLMLPIDGSLDYAETSLFVRGERIIIERVLLEGDRLILVGDGTVNFDNMEVDLILRSRGRVIGLSELLATLSDRIYAIHVTGPLESPTARLIPVPDVAETLTSDR